MKDGVWFVLATHPHREAVAMRNLARQDFRAYCPMTVRHIRHARRAHDALRPLFPGYIFTEQDLAQRWRPLLSTTGVRNVVMSGETPARLPPGFVEGLQSREVNGSIRKPETPFLIGQQVTICGGVFDGLICEIAEMKENDRVLVLLDLLKRQTRIYIRAKHLA